MKKWIIKFDHHGQTYYYFRRHRWPHLRLRGKPGSPEFEELYERALAAKTKEEFIALRYEVNMRDPRKNNWSEGTTAIMRWAEHKPLTRRQVELLQASPLRLTLAEIRHRKDNGGNGHAAADR